MPRTAKKDIIITAGGKNIAPQKIESSLMESRYIEQVCVIGDRKSYLTALVVPAFDELTCWALEKTISFRDNEKLIQDPRVIGLYEKEVEKCTRHLARVEKIKKYKLLSTEWTPQSCELTPTLKIKRRIVEEKYREIIDEMYNDQ